MARPSRGIVARRRDDRNPAAGRGRPFNGRYSRVMGGYHIQADNVAGLDLGSKVARQNWGVIRTYFDGTFGKK